ncbi:MAG TPA: amidohydrolase family protein [Gemmataceae bacterium]|nr:amidohydrolase family protein [Gemmataceae bacterium]
MCKRCAFLGGVFVLALFAGVPPMGAQPTPVLQPTVFAIRDARVVPEAGKLLTRATVVIRDGLIEEVGPDVRIPAEALVIDGKGLTVYPGFLDALSNWGFDPALRRSESGPPAPEDYASGALATTKPDNRKGMTPEFQVATALKAEEDKADTWRQIGFTAHLVAPDGGLFAGQSAMVSLSNAPPREAVLRSPVALHAAFRDTGPDYPRVLMGFIAHCRQTLLDAGHYQRAWTMFERAGRVGRRPPLDPALAELGTILSGKLPVVLEADSKDEIHRALDFAEEFHLRPILYGGRDAWKAAERIKHLNVPVLLRLTFSDKPQPRFGRRGGGPSPAGLGAGPAPEADQAAVPKRIEEFRQQQLKEEVRNAALLHQHGILFAFCTQGQPTDKPADKFRENLRKAIQEGGLSPEAALKALTEDAARILGVGKQLGTLAAGKAAHLIVTDGDFQDVQTQVRYVFADGVRFTFDSKAQTAGKSAEAKKPAEKSTPVTNPEESKAPASRAAADAKVEQATEIEADRKPKLHTRGNVLIRGGDVLTVTNGRLPQTDILVLNGKIAKLGKNLEAPADVKLLPAEGMVIMPGIIDTHCHFAVAGGVNEFSLSVVPEVRVRDVIDSEDVQIYRALAGGVTTARLLHGSANVIGGQDAVIKLKYGEPASRLLIADAPRGVKFALGENVKRTDGRFPNTRLGVEAVLIRAFTEAQAYRRAWDAYEKAKSSGKPLPEPRRDLRLEALADVLKGDLKVHCHCYRADEILMLMNVAERFGFRVQSLQHVLEGYKIAPEIAAHGSSCSTFSDWWAYKIEAYDAIPFNAALLHEAGVTVCVKSDSNELMRHLYQEAAKCVKYGGMSEEEALKTITLNGAKQLGLEKRLGSIEVGKDADLVIFNGHPLNSYARPELTLVEGEVYFQRSEQLQPGPGASAGPSTATGVFAAIPRNRAGDYVLRGVTVHPVASPAVANAQVVIQKGKIAALLGASQKENGPLPPGGTVVDATGLHLYPGMIDAATVLGLTELGSARETNDYAEGGDFQPDLRASVAINPDSELIPVTRANGVTTVLTRPTGSLIAGQSALINLVGWVPKDMAVVDPLALHVEFPSPSRMFTGGDPSMRRLGQAITRKQREEKMRRLKELFQQAVAYDNARRQGSDQSVNPRLEALAPYARGQKPVIIQVQRRQEILDALKLADELKLKVILSGAIDAWKVVAELKKRDVPVIVGPTMTLPQETYDPYDAPYACPARLQEAGVRFCIRSAGTTNTRNLPYEAAMAVSYGLPLEEGLKAVTLYPAQILGVADQLGTIEPGKRANLVLADGDILQAATQVKALFIDGQPLEPVSKHTKLYERYRQRLHEVQQGRAQGGNN